METYSVGYHLHWCRTSTKVNPKFTQSYVSKFIEQYVWKEASPIATLVLECLHQCVQSCLKLFFAKQTKDIQQYIDI